MIEPSLKALEHHDIRNEDSARIARFSLEPTSTSLTSPFPHCSQSTTPATPAAVLNSCSRHSIAPANSSRPAAASRMSRPGTGCQAAVRRCEECRARRCPAGGRRSPGLPAPRCPVRSAPPQPAPPGSAGPRGARPRGRAGGGGGAGGGGVRRRAGPGGAAAPGTRRRCPDTAGAEGPVAFAAAMAGRPPPAAPR
ncbi:LOW QUALITY PROTEIN: translation initiation factor IF-2-like [Vidua chalybeata]|uniref:LOW QUALITY PROTEIN: translation initiation factor IF-2-like n=1 Tax=Vidua chalybeata TaxID=81927 RepID=UPI0023A8AA06|nr:LOW QUALITY PROTEIN: translation initiation factor IF-2-like [Vidua chalybeata]